MKGHNEYVEDQRFKQCHREVWYTIGFFVFNVLLVFALVFPSYHVPASEIKIVAGFPSWYFYGVIVATGLLVVVATLMIKFLFKDMPLDGYLEEDEE